MSATLPVALPHYAELHCLSNFTFLRGASHAEELVQRAAALGYTALAITDECSLAGVVRAHVAAKDAGFKLIIGSEIRLDDGMRLVLLAMDREGYGNLSSLITRGRGRSAKGAYSLQRGDLDDGLPGCLALLVPACTVSTQPDDLTGQAAATWLAERFAGRAWIATELHAGPDDRTKLASLRSLSSASGLPLVAAGDVHMHLRSRRRLQDVLTAIRLRTPVHRCGYSLYSNGERHLRQRMRLAQLYPAEMLAETLVIAARCSFDPDMLRYEYPRELVPDGETPTSHLRTLTMDGLRWRFPQGVPGPVMKGVKKELALIAELGYEAFFLTVHDIVQFAKRAEILFQGRGSAANSTVCYALGITAVNPAKQELLFERFLSKERNEPPDIDVDFEHQRREEVIQYIYDKYGRDRAALAATVICYKPRSALRDVGKALGFDAQQVTLLTSSMAWWDDRSKLDSRLLEAGFDLASPATRDLATFATTLQRFPRHLSQHVGGFVISNGPLAQLVPIENAAMKDRSVIQWDKEDLESLGLLKVDVLALGMLTVVHRALAMVNARTNAPYPTPVSMDSLMKQDDAAVYDMICKADTVGVFQIESRAQMSMLPRLKPRKFYDLVIEVAIVRPGPIQGGMVHPYLKRRDGREKVDYPSDAVEAVLERTLGIPIFQEQVMQLAVVAAGFSPGEADQVRRSMAAWSRKGGLEHLQAKLIDGMLGRGYAREFAERIYKQILGFGEYGFPESHSVSFALLAYVSAWLKHYHPAAFLAALLNSQPMGFYGPSQLVQDARRHGVEVRPVDVLSSDWECTLEYGPEHAPSHALSTDMSTQHFSQPAVRLGLCMVRGLPQDAAERVVATRRSDLSGLSCVADLARHAELDHTDLRRLAAAGALESLAGHRRQAHWTVAGIDTLRSMLSDAPVDETPLVLPAAGEGDELLADYASLGLTLGRHPLALLRARLGHMGFITAEVTRTFTVGKRIRAAGLVTGRQRPGTASGVVFVTLEDETGSVNVIVWRDLADSQRRELLKSRLMGVEGVLEREGDVTHLIARRIFDHSALLGRLQTRSRDFH